MAGIHLIVRDHSPIIPELLHEQLSTFGGGCNNAPPGIAEAVQYHASYGKNHYLSRVMALATRKATPITAKRMEMYRSIFSDEILPWNFEPN